MSVPVKRKRGRPRLDEPREIKDFDNNLIEEFKKYPVFYDRQHLQHRNRDYTIRIWQRIAQNLGVSLNLVKTRMLQLRNRFNLEKRRVEALREQQPHSAITSQWSLYENLSFLGDYVKTRRPYSLPASFNAKVDTTATSSDAEDEDDDDDDDEQQQAEGNQLTESVLKPNQILLNGNLLADKQKENGLNHSRAASNQNHFNHIENNAPLHNQQVKKQHLEVTDFGRNKYLAFGQFLASSLIEMNEVQALNLVGKFTTELVKYLKNEERKTTSMQASQNNTMEDEENNSLSIY